MMNKTEQAWLEQLQYAVDAHAIVSVSAADGRIIHVNDQFCQTSGFGREELLGQNHRIVKSGLHAADFYQALWQTISSGQVWRGEICNLRKNGSLYWVDASIIPFLDEAGLPMRYLSIRTDITALKVSEEALRSSDERLRRSQVFANIGTWDWNVVTGELYWSERIATLFGYANGELETSYENFIGAVHPDDRDAVATAVADCVERDKPYEIEHRVVWPDGQVRWLLERGAVIRDPAGQPLHMLGVVQDIDQRKRAELALAESEERFSFAVEGAGDGVWDWNILTNTVMLSANFEGMLGFAKGEIRPDSADWKEFTHPDDLPHVRKLFQSYLAGRTESYVVEQRLRCKNGEYKWVLCRGTIVARDEAGNPLRMIGIHSDISASKQTEVDLTVAREEADRANRAKSDFLSAMSHELRSPMNAIMGFAQMLESDAKLDSDQQDNVHEILKAGRHLLVLINEVLDLAKIEAGHVDMSLEPVRISPLVEDCRHLFLPLLATRNVSLSIDLAEEIVVRADAVRLKQVLVNLLSNATKYNRDGGQVLVTAEPAEAGRVRVFVSDSGIGIAPERIGELFQPFTRLAPDQAGIEGTGIGLSITQRLVNLMGGTVGVESQLGIGSRFWIELPTASILPAAELTAAMLAEQAAHTSSTQLYRVLCVDDNPANLKLVRQIFGQRNDVDLLTAHTPELGMEMALAHCPHLILLDINMPGMDGYQMLKAVKAQKRLKAIPVFAVTANAMPRDIERGRKAGFSEYITKPLNIKAFLETVDRYLLA